MAQPRLSTVRQARARRMPRAREAEARLHFAHPAHAACAKCGGTNHAKDDCICFVGEYGHKELDCGQQQHPRSSTEATAAAHGNATSQQVLRYPQQSQLSPSQQTCVSCENQNPKRRHIKEMVFWCDTAESSVGNYSQRRLH